MKSLANRCPTCGVTAFRLGYWPSRRPGCIVNRHGRARRVVRVYHYAKAWRRRAWDERPEVHIVSWREPKFKVIPSVGSTTYMRTTTRIRCTDPWHERTGVPEYRTPVDTQVSQSRLPKRHDPLRSRRNYLAKRQLQGKDRR